MTIQETIDKDTLFLQTCSKKKFDEYKSWFYSPDHDIEPKWYKAIDQVIKDLEATK